MDPRIQRISIRTALSALADLAMPRVCVVCGRKLIPQEKHICLNCLADLPETHFSLSAHNPMADKLNGRIPSEADPGRYSYATALFYYEGDEGYARITQALKYGRNFAAGRYFAAMLGERMAASEVFADVDAVVPVPLHWTRRWKRGYNQAEVIAEELAKALECGCRPGALKRLRRTKTQTRLGVEQKETNVRGAFRAHAGTLDGVRHVLIVDDVFTTGATLSECLLALRKVCGQEVRISVATLAYAGH